MVSSTQEAEQHLSYPPRQWHSQVPFISTKSTPPPSSLDAADLLPENDASWLSYITFSWMTPLLAKGYARPIEATDLYDMGSDRAAELYANRITASFERREREAEEYNRRLDAGLVDPPVFKSLWWTVRGQGRTRRAKWIETAQRRKPSLALACNDAVFWWFWTGGFFRLVADVGTMTSPLLIKAIINFSTTSRNDINGGLALPSIAPGIGLAIGILLVLLVILLCNAQAYYRGYTTGVILRGALIHALFVRATKLTSRARSSSSSSSSSSKMGAGTGYTTGKLTSLISADVSRIDFCMAYFHMAFTAPVQLGICLIILCINLGYSALPGFAFFVVCSPVQGRITKRLFLLRKRSMAWTDRRIGGLQEGLGGMRVVKVFAWEIPFLSRIEKLRNEEMRFLRTRLIWRSINNALGFGLPTLAAVISFVVYAATGHQLEASVIFSSLSLFNLLRTPLTFLPVALSSMADAYNAIQRVRGVMLAEVITESIHVDPRAELAIQVREGWFCWDSDEGEGRGEEVKGKGDVSTKDEDGSATASKKGASSTTTALNLNPNPNPESEGGEDAEKVEEKEKDNAEEEKEKEKETENENVNPESKPKSKPKPKPKPEKKNRPFALQNISLSIPRGQLVAIVGPVGAGKSSLLQALLGEMRRIPTNWTEGMEGQVETNRTRTSGKVQTNRPGPHKKPGKSEPARARARARAGPLAGKGEPGKGEPGKVTFGDTVGYVPQIAWIQSSTIRENILFGREWEEGRYWEVVRACCLERDFEMWESGDLTEVGEKGISLSGGQRQRISIARALYFQAPITLFDDSFSALDAHVGKDVFNNVIKNALGGKTRVLVTHALQFLKEVDWVIVMEDGRVVEEGSYDELMRGGVLERFVREFGGSEEEDAGVGVGVGVGVGMGRELNADVKEHKANDAKTGTGDGKEKAVVVATKVPPKKVMQSEDRNVGSVNIKVYMEFFKAGGLGYTFPLFLIAVCFFQGSSVLSPYWLVFWEDEQFDIPQGAYMGVYAVLGFAQAFGLFSMGAVFAMFTFHASQVIHKRALHRVVHAPISFFDTTPLGRIMNRFSKDIDTLDNVLGEALRQFLGTAVQVIGSIVLVSIIIPWFLIAIVFILLLYYWIAIFYRASARELRRIDAILRSQLYGHFSESMSGLATIRAYGETKRFQDENARRINLENRAYWLTVTNQRWLSVRLDFLGSIMVFAVAILAVGTRTSISPAQTGVVLSYMLVVQQAFGWAVRQSAEVENNMNAVERLLYYTNEIEQEAPHEIPENKPPLGWPSAGALEMKDVVASYRPGLPPVLKGVSLDVRGGEHVGIVGRTGAGKSTITMTLYRTMELLSGHIKIDGVDISKIGLRDLRSSLSIIPQDAILFSGDLRSNLDPFGQYDDARLWDALRRSYLVDSTKSEVSSSNSASGEDIVSGHGLTLDTRIEEGGANLSVGQRSLVSLARALAKDSRIIIMDEATASVDFETDRNIQDTVQSEFSNRTLLCIAHRLRTIIGYDRICVVDEGLVKEYDAPETLYQKENGIFRGMCESSGISLMDIRLAREQSEQYKKF